MKSGKKRSGKVRGRLGVYESREDMLKEIEKNLNAVLRRI